jgi:hypothetical protein
MKDKRRLKRFDLKIPATIELMDSDRKEGIVNLRTSNMCSSGAYFHTTKPLPEGTRVKIDLVLPLDRLKRLEDGCKRAYIKITGRVLRSGSKGMAICFDEDYQLVGSARLIM